MSEEKVMGTKFTMSVQTIGALAMVIASGVGGYYMLLQEIEEAKNLPEPPSIESIFGDEYPSKPDGHNWPRSYEQYKTQVANISSQFGDTFKDKGLDLDSLASNIQAGGDVGDLIPNFQLPDGETIPIELPSNIAFPSIEGIKEKLESMPEFKIEIDSEELKKKAQEALDAIQKEQNKIKQETESKLTLV